MCLYSRGRGLRWLFAAAPSCLPPPSNLMIWAALNAFPFGLITLWEDWHHVRSERAISPPWPLGKTAVSLCMYSWACMCVYIYEDTVFVHVGWGGFLPSLSYTQIQRNTFSFQSDQQISSHQFFFWTSVFSFGTHLMSEQEIKSAAYSTRLGAFI